MTAMVERFWRNLRLRQKLGVAFVLMTVLPLLCTTLIIWRPYEQAMAVAVEKRNQERAEQIATELEWTFAEKTRMMTMIANNEEITSMNPERQKPVLAYITEQYPDVQLAVVADEGGRQIARWDWRNADPAIQYADRAYFQELKRTGRTAISDVVRSRSTQRLGIVMAEPIRDERGNVNGALIINLELEKLIQRVSNTMGGQDGYAYVVDPQGNVMLHPDRGLIENGMKETVIAPVIAAMQGSSGWLEYEADGKARLAGYSSVPSTKMIVVVQQPKAEAMLAVDAIKQRSLLVLLLASSLAIALGLTIAGALARPLARIAAAVERLRAGEWNVRLKTSGQDEIHQLAAAFNSLAEQLAKRDAELKRVTENLERQVAERTCELRQANEELRLVSQLDGLTGIANRRSFDEALRREWRRAMRDEEPLALIMLDADHFKAYNDTYGHQAGDECLKFIAAQVKAAAKRSTDLAARYGGEEFALILTECDLAGAAQVAERLRSSIEEAAWPHAGSAVAKVVTVSLGVVAVCPQQEEQALELVAAADRAMYRAKQSGRNRVCLASPDCEGKEGLKSCEGGENR